MSWIGNLAANVAQGVGDVAGIVTDNVAHGVSNVANSAGQIAGQTANATWSAGAQLTSGAVGLVSNLSEATVKNNTKKSLMVMWWGYQDTVYSGFDGFEMVPPGGSVITRYAKPDPQGVQVGVVHTVEHMDISEYIKCAISLSSETLDLGSMKLYFQLTCCKSGSPISIESVRGDASDPSKGEVQFSGNHWWGGLYPPHASARTNQSLANWFAGKAIDLGALGLDLISLGSSAGAKAVAKEVAKKLADQIYDEFKKNLVTKLRSVAAETRQGIVEDMLQKYLSAFQLPPATITGIAKLLIGGNREVIESFKFK